MNNKLLIRELERKIARLTNERDSLKRACHKHAAKHSAGREWTELQRIIDEQREEIEQLELRLVSRPPNRHNRAALLRALTTRRKAA